MPNLIPTAELETQTALVRDNIRWLYERWDGWRDGGLWEITDPEWQEFVMKLEATDNLDKAIRVVGGVTACVWGEGKSCPQTGPLSCGGCTEPWTGE